jgi:hypothetical protein
MYHPLFVSSVDHRLTFFQHLYALAVVPEHLS